MKEAITSFVGLDVHKSSLAIAVAQAGREAPHFVGTVPPSMSTLCKTLRRVCRAEHTLVVYEAGPCGYGWARHLRAHGWRCEIIAPARIARSPAERRIKTDRRDALLLARESRAGNLVSVVMPDERDEAVRDLSRTREDACAARLRARQQLKAMLLRHGHAYQGKTSWTLAHERHLSTIHFTQPAQQIAFEEYRQAVKEAHERLERLTEQLREQCARWRMNPLVRALMCLRSLDFVSAATFVAEIGDPRRFAHPRQRWRIWGWCPRNTPVGRLAIRGRSPRPETSMPGASWWKRPGIIVTAHGSAVCWRSASRVNPKPSVR